MTPAANAATATSTFETKTCVSSPASPDCPDVSFIQRSFTAPLASFDPSLGRLRGVTVDIDHVYSTRFDYAPFSGSGVAYYFYIHNFDISISLPVTGTADEYDGYLFTVLGAGYSGPADGVIEPGDDSGPINMDYRKSETLFISDPGLVEVLASGRGLLITYNLSDATYVQDYTGGTFVSQHSWEATLTATARFDYGVPEPATWAMLISGMGMVGGTLRRRPRAKHAYAEK